MINSIMNRVFWVGKENGKTASRTDCKKIIMRLEKSGWNVSTLTVNYPSRARPTTKRDKSQQELLYKKGKNEGIQKSYYESGSIEAEITSKEGVIEGPFKFYDESGSILNHGEFHNWQLAEE